MAAIAVWWEMYFSQMDLDEGAILQFVLPPSRTILGRSRYRLPADFAPGKFVEIVEGAVVGYFAEMLQPVVDEPAVAVVAAAGIGTIV